MSNLKISLFMILVFVASAFAGVGLPQAQAANEVDIDACTKSGVNMKDYCLGYCELQSGMACTSAQYTETADMNNIDQCVCTCGLGDELKTYDHVPCGVDLMQKGTPSGTQYTDSGSSSSSCCLPVFILLALVGFVTMRR